MYVRKDLVFKVYKDIKIPIKNNNYIYKLYIITKAINKRLKERTVPVVFQPLEFIYVDIVSYNVPGYISYKYIVYFINDILRFVWLRFYIKKGNAAI